MAKTGHKPKSSRHSVFNPDMIKRVRQYAMLGLSDIRIAKLLDVSEGTFETWKKTKPWLVEALYEGREGADAAVAAAMHSRAVGYNHPAVKIFLPPAAKGADGQSVGTPEPVIVPYMEHYPPDVGAGKYWLSSKYREQWTDKTTSDVNLKGSIDVNTTGISGLLAAVREAQAKADQPESDKPESDKPEAAQTDDDEET